MPFFRDTFFEPLRNYGYHFHNFLTFHGIMGVLFKGFFIISGIMAQILLSDRSYVFRIAQKFQEFLTFWSEFFSGTKDYQIFNNDSSLKIFPMILKDFSKIL